jgi:hypothetical protein
MVKFPKTIAILLFATLPLTAKPICAQHLEKAVSSKKPCDLPKEEVDVYAAYLRSEASPNNLTVLVTTTEGYIEDVDSYNLGPAAQGHGIPAEVRADFIQKNKAPCVIQRFGGVPNLHFISKGEETRIFAAGWSEFHRKYGRGAEIDTVSRVGFHSDKTLALLHILGASGNNAAAGELLLLERKDGRWTVKFQTQTMAI